MPYEFMGCKAGCILRHQTNATSDGNVAGWHGTTFHSDDSGNTTYSNNGSVKWDESDKTYSINSETNNLEVIRKSLVAIKEIKNGDAFSVENVGAKRPGSGISPMDWSRIKGKKSKRGYLVDDLIIDES